MCTFYKIIYISMIVSLVSVESAIAQNQRRSSGLSQLEFDNSKTPKATPEPARSLDPAEQIIKIINNQKQINSLKSEKPKVEIENEVTESAPETIKKSKGIHQLD
jgi:hypothetical protein